MFGEIVINDAAPALAVLRGDMVATGPLLAPAGPAPGPLIKARISISSLTF
jgi:hypothetical protein